MDNLQESQESIVITFLGNTRRYERILSARQQCLFDLVEKPKTFI
jgi:hypothetical protein